MNLQRTGLLQKPELRAGTSLTPPAGTQLSQPQKETHKVFQRRLLQSEVQTASTYPTWPQHFHPVYLLIQAKSSNTSHCNCGQSNPPDSFAPAQNHGLSPSHGHYENALSWPLEPLATATAASQASPLAHTPVCRGECFVCVPLAQLDWKCKPPLRENGAKGKHWLQPWCCGTILCVHHEERPVTDSHVHHEQSPFSYCWWPSSQKEKKTNKPKNPVAFS